METLTEENVQDVIVQESDPFTTIKGEVRFTMVVDEEVFTVIESKERDPAFA